MSTYIVASLATGLLQSAPLRHVPIADRFYGRITKRLVDLALAGLAITVALLPIAMIAVLIARDGGHPFYVQDRVGRGGRVFRMWKLRTMVTGAEAMLAAHLRANPAARQEWETRQKLLDDPRVTRLGQWLRKTSIDELPQLWNVLRGDMSLVGPRPILPDQRAIYPASGYYSVRPGLTGRWQVLCRNAGAFSDRAALDEEYLRRMSLFTDLWLMFATVRVVCRGTGR